MMNNLIQTYCDRFHGEHDELYTNSVPDAQAAAWMEEQVPHFTCSDKEVEEAYYFRWWTFRKHIRSTPEGRIITEFLPDVPWAGKYNAIACPVGHHILEGRWLADSELIKEDIRFFLSDAQLENTLRYSNTLVWSAFQFILHTGDREFAAEILPGLKRLFAERCARHMSARGLFWSNDGRDGMEYSISGCGLRPTINAYEYASAAAIGELCLQTLDSESMSYNMIAEDFRDLIHTYLWDSKDGFFKTIPLDDPNGEADFDRRNPDRNVMEEIGFVPFCIDGLTLPEHESAYRYLTDPRHFQAPYGITTADMAHPRFMKCDVVHECLWDGPVWPYATSQTLTGIYKVLADHDSAYITANDYMHMLQVYAASQKLTENGRTIRWIDEDMHPFNGSWISRDEILHNPAYEGKFPAERGADYNHSTFCDLVLSGACGISINNGTLRIKPLAIGTWDSFSVTNLHIGGKVYELHYATAGSSTPAAAGNSCDAAARNAGACDAADKSTCNAAALPLKLYCEGSLVAEGETSLEYKF